MSPDAFHNACPPNSGFIDRICSGSYRALVAPDFADVSAWGALHPQTKSGQWRSSTGDPRRVWCSTRPCDIQAETPGFPSETTTSEHLWTPHLRWVLKNFLDVCQNRTLFRDPEKSKKPHSHGIHEIAKALDHHHAFFDLSTMSWSILTARGLD